MTWVRSPRGRSAAAAGQGPRPSVAGSPRRALASPSPSAHRRTRRRLAAARPPGPRLQARPARRPPRAASAARPPAAGRPPRPDGAGPLRTLPPSRPHPRRAGLLQRPRSRRRSAGPKGDDRRTSGARRCWRHCVSPQRIRSMASPCCLGPMPVVVPDQNHSDDHQHEHTKHRKEGATLHRHASLMAAGAIKPVPPAASSPAASGESTDCSGRRRTEGRSPWARRSPCPSVRGGGRSCRLA